MVDDKTGKLYCDICEKEIEYEEVESGDAIVLASPETAWTVALASHYHIKCLESAPDDDY
jgi:hypothetical protein